MGSFVLAGLSFLYFSYYFCLFLTISLVLYIILACLFLEDFSHVTSASSILVEIPQFARTFSTPDIAEIIDSAESYWMVLIHV